MKNLFYLALLVTFLAAAARAEPPPDEDRQGQAQGQRHGQGHGQQGSGDRLARMQRNLGLTDDQVKQMREIRERGGSREEMRAVLTEEQLLIMQERRRQAQERKQSGRKDPSRYYTQPGETHPPDPEGGRG